MTLDICHDKAVLVFGTEQNHNIYSHCLSSKFKDVFLSAVQSFH